MAERPVGRAPLLDWFDVLAAEFLLGLGQCGQEHRRQDGDDRNDHQQFDQRFRL